MLHKILKTGPDDLLKNIRLLLHVEEIGEGRCGVKALHLRSKPKNIGRSAQ